MKRTTIIIAIFAIFCVAAHAQTSYHNAIKAYINSSPTVLESIKRPTTEPFQKINEIVMKNFNQQQSDALVKKYINGPFLDDLIDSLMVPIMEKNASISDLQTMTRFMTSNEGKQFQAHLAKMNANLKQFSEKAQKAVEDIMAGRTPKAEKPRPEIPQTYRQQFNRYHELTQLDNIGKQMMNVLKNQYNSSDQDIIKKFENDFNANMKIFYLTSCFNYLTASDINFGIKAYGSEAYKHIASSLNNLSENAQSRSMAIIGAYINWLGEQGVEFKDDL